MTFSLDVLQEMVTAVAREELLPRFASVERSHKVDGSVLTEADLAVQNRLARQLQQQWPGTVFLGEEMTAEQQAELLT